MKSKYLRGAVWQLVQVQELQNVTHFEFQALGMRERMTIVLHACGHVELVRRVSADEPPARSAQAHQRYRAPDAGDHGADA
jgi:hypothetical protein